jgi:methionyl-tRNA formyltransferase
VTIMKMDAGLDTGPILVQARTEISAEDNSQTLHDRLAKMGAELLARTIPDYVAGQLPVQAQPEEGACYARKIVKEDGWIDWRLSAREIWNRARAFTPWPGCFTRLPGGMLLKIWTAKPAPGLAQAGAPGAVLKADSEGLHVQCGEGVLVLNIVQREGGKRMGVKEFLAGCRLAPGDVLGAGQPF